MCSKDTKEICKKNSKGEEKLYTIPAVIYQAICTDIKENFEQMYIEA